MARVLKHSVAALSAAGLGLAGLLSLPFRPAWRHGLQERLGAHSVEPAGTLWIHGASVGEIMASSHLVDALLKAGYTLHLSTTTLAGREVVRNRYPHLSCELSPLDHRWCVQRALNLVRPSALILVETEIWPVWIDEACFRGIPVLIISGRISDRSFPRYQKLKFWTASILKKVSAIGARSREDANRFLELGASPASVQVTGDLKLDRAQFVPAPPMEIVQALGGDPVWIAASTHEGEEAAVLSALRMVEEAGRPIRLVLAPRHLDRLDSVISLLKSQGRVFQRRSELKGEPLHEGEILLIDTIGELVSLFSLCEAAFVGGSLVDRGGHNVLEPVLYGKPVIFGPHWSNVREAVQLLRESESGREVANTEELGEVLLNWWSDADSMREAGERGKRVLEEHEGSVTRTIQLIDSIVSRESTEESP